MSACRWFRCLVGVAGGFVVVSCCCSQVQARPVKMARLLHAALDLGSGAPAGVRIHCGPSAGCSSQGSPFGRRGAPRAWVVGLTSCSQHRSTTFLFDRGRVEDSDSGQGQPHATKTSSSVFFLLSGFTLSTGHRRHHARSNNAQRTASSMTLATDPKHQHRHNGR